MFGMLVRNALGRPHFGGLAGVQCGIVVETVLFYAKVEEIVKAWL